MELHFPDIGTQRKKLIENKLSTENNYLFLLDDQALQISAIEILSGLCFVPEDGHKQVLTAITQVRSLFTWLSE